MRVTNYCSLYDRCVPMAGGTSGHSGFHYVLWRQDETIVAREEKQLHVHYECLEHQDLNSIDVVIQGYHFLDLLAKDSPEDTWRGKAQKAVLDYLSERLLYCEYDPHVRIAKIALANKALQYLKNLPEQITVEHRNKWADFCKSRLVEKSFFSECALRACFLAVDAILAEQFPLQFISETALSTSDSQALTLRTFVVGKAPSIYFRTAPGFVFGAGQSFRLSDDCWADINRDSSGNLSPLGRCQRLIANYLKSILLSPTANLGGRRDYEAWMKDLRVAVKLWEKCADATLTEQDLEIDKPGKILRGMLSTCKKILEECLLTRVFKRQDYVASSDITGQMLARVSVSNSALSELQRISHIDGEWRVIESIQIKNEWLEVEDDVSPGDAVELSILSKEDVNTRCQKLLKAYLFEVIEGNQSELGDSDEITYVLRFDAIRLAIFLLQKLEAQQKLKPSDLEFRAGDLISKTLVEIKEIIPQVEEPMSAAWASTFAKVRAAAAERNAARKLNR